MTNINIIQGVPFSQDITVSDTAGKTYSAGIVTNRWCFVRSFTVAVINATTVRISLTADQTEALPFPVQARPEDRSYDFGFWDIVEDGSAGQFVDSGKVVLTRKATP